jgi:hypothetical protein
MKQFTGRRLNDLELLHREKKKKREIENLESHSRLIYHSLFVKNLAISSVDFADSSLFVNNLNANGFIT